MSIDKARDGELAFGDFVLDCHDERLIGRNGPIKIGNKAFKVLLLLAQQNGRLLTKDALFSSVWDGTIVSESSLTSVIKELRRALGDESRTPRYIESVYGRGYRFIAPVKMPERKGAPPPASRGFAASACGWAKRAVPGRAAAPLLPSARGRSRSGWAVPQWKRIDAPYSAGV